MCESLPEVQVLLCGRVELYQHSDIMEIKVKINKAHNFERYKVEVCFNVKMKCGWI